MDNIEVVLISKAGGTLWEVSLERQDTKERWFVWMAPDHASAANYANNLGTFLGVPVSCTYDKGRKT